MNTSPNPSPELATADPEPQMRALRIVLTMALLGAVLGFLGADILIYRQLQDVRTMLHNNEALLAKFNENDAPVLSNLLIRLSEFAKANPDFQPILNVHLAALARVQGESGSRSGGAEGEMPTGAVPGIPAPRPNSP